MKLFDEFQYRSDIDGLRAIAVSIVVLHHAEFGFPGGFVGVDVFFVISGFLITSLIWKDLERERFSFINFWARRARRIVPPFVVLTLVTLIVGCFILLPVDFKSLGWAASAQAIFAANIHYWRDSGYFAALADEKPLLHTWSLAVEEQFYFFAPFLLWAMFRMKLKLMSVIKLLCFCLGISLAISVYGVALKPVAAFYLLPPRAWELLVGATLAFLPAVSFNRRVRDAMALIGILLICIPVFAYSAVTPFPGLAAIPPCLGTAILIYGNKEKTIVGSILSSRPFVFVGLISYSLYLWHWFFFSYGKYMSSQPLSFQLRIGLIVLSFVLALISWKYVETPFRIRRIAQSQTAVLIFAAAGLVLVFVFGIVVFIGEGFPNRFSRKTIDFAAAAQDQSYGIELTIEDIRLGRLVRIGVRDQTPSAMFWGDSHAMAALPAFDAFLKERNLGGRAATHSTVAPVLNWYLDSTTLGLNRDAIEYNNEILAFIQDQNISDVVLCAKWNTYSVTDGSFHSALLATIRRLEALGIQAWVMRDVPVYGFNIPRALARSFYSVSEVKPLYSSDEEFEESYVAEMQRSGARILDPKPDFKDSSGNFIIQRDGIVLYRDDDHLTTKGALVTLLPMFRRDLRLVDDNNRAGDKGG